MSSCSSRKHRLVALLVISPASLWSTAFRLPLSRAHRAGGWALGFGGQRTNTAEHKEKGSSYGRSRNAQWWALPVNRIKARSRNLVPTRFRLEIDELLPVHVGPFSYSTVSYDPTISQSSSRAPDSALEAHVSRSEEVSFLPDPSRSVSTLHHKTSNILEDPSYLLQLNSQSLQDPPLISSQASGPEELHQPWPSLLEPGPVRPKPEYDQNNNFTLNLGRALDRLKIDVPLYFEREPDLKIYTEDIRFRDDSRIYSNGRFMYQMFFFTLRLARVFMPLPPIVEVLNMRWCPIRQCIYVRFQVRIDALNDTLYYDATSVYRVNSQGMIYEHLIENVIRNDLVSPSIVRLYYTTKQILMAPGSPVPEPVGRCQTSLQRPSQVGPAL